MRLRHNIQRGTKLTGVAHTFLVQAGRWVLEGSLSERGRNPIPFKGRTLVAWNENAWFDIVTKIVFPGSAQDELMFKYRGRLAEGERQYNFVLQHSHMGRIEGEGWISPRSIVQRYWVLGDRQRRAGFETIHQAKDNLYYLSSGIMAGHHLVSTMEASLERQSS